MWPLGFLISAQSIEPLKIPPALKRGHVWLAMPLGKAGSVKAIEHAKGRQDAEMLMLRQEYIARGGSRELPLPQLRLGDHLEVRQVQEVREAL
jgi:hypothetical protein